MYGGMTWNPDLAEPTYFPEFWLLNTQAFQSGQKVWYKIPTVGGESRAYFGMVSDQKDPSNGTDNIPKIYLSGGISPALTPDVVECTLALGTNPPSITCNTICTQPGDFTGLSHVQLVPSPVTSEELFRATQFGGLRYHLAGNNYAPLDTTLEMEQTTNGLISHCFSVVRITNDPGLNNMNWPSSRFAYGMTRLNGQEIFLFGGTNQVLDDRRSMSIQSGSLLGDWYLYFNP